MAERTDMNAKELNGIEFLAALSGQMDKHCMILKPRLKAIPNAWRQYRLIESALHRLLGDMYQTLTVKSLQRIKNMMQYGEVKIAIAPIERHALGYVTVHEKDLALVVTTAMQGECAMCIKDGDDVKRCPLRKALWEMMPPDEVPRFGCPFRDNAMEGCKTDAEIAKLEWEKKRGAEGD